jgi:hypothetical protein
LIASQIIRAVSPWLPLAVTVALSSWLLLMVMPVIVRPAVAVVTRISPVEFTAAPSAGPVASTGRPLAAVPTAAACTVTVAPTTEQV